LIEKKPFFDGAAQEEVTSGVKEKDVARCGIFGHSVVLEIRTLPGPAKWPFINFGPLPQGLSLQMYSCQLLIFKSSNEVL
jgi:hypothetical protein